MNYSIAVNQDAYTIAVGGIPEEKELITPKASSNPNEAVIRKLKRYAEKRGITVYEMTHISPVPSVSCSNGWYYYDSTKNIRSITVNSSITEAAKVNVLIHLLCLCEATKKQWRLYLSDEVRFDARLNTLIAKVTKLVGLESIPAS